jgi:hypothetical protein
MITLCHLPHFQIAVCQGGGLPVRIMVIGTATVIRSPDLVSVLSRNTAITTLKYPVEAFHHGIRITLYVSFDIPPHETKKATASLKGWVAF